MSNGPTKIFIQVDSESEQQDHIKSARKKLVVLQKTANKENLVGRPHPTFGKENNLGKSESSDFSSCVELKRKTKTVVSCATQTCEINITADDLTTDCPSEKYWENLAEKRREALDETLEENQKLHEKIESLEDELNTSRKLVEETRHLVEVLKEMLQETDEDDDSDDNDEAEIEL